MQSFTLRRIAFIAEGIVAALLLFSPPSLLVGAYGVGHDGPFDLGFEEEDGNPVYQRPWTPLPPPGVVEVRPPPPSPPPPPPEPPPAEAARPPRPVSGRGPGPKVEAQPAPVVTPPNPPNTTPGAGEPSLDDMAALAEADDAAAQGNGTNRPRPKARPKKPKPKVATRKCGDPMPEVQVLGPNHWSVDRELAEEYATNMTLLQSLGWVRQHRDAEGKPDGWRIGGIECGNLLHQAGFRRGDIVQAVNGRPVRTIFQVISAYLSERKKDTIVVELVRKNELRQFTYELIRPEEDPPKNRRAERERSERRDRKRQTRNSPEDLNPGRP